MKSILLSVLALVSLAIANEVANINTQEKAYCPSGCNPGYICLGCNDGSSGCFPAGYSTYTCCGCNGVCQACAPGDMCVRDYTKASGYRCDVRVNFNLSPGAITGIVIGGVVFIFVVAVIIACVRRRYSSYETVTYGTSYGASVYTPPPVIVTTDFHHHHGHHHHGGGAVGYQASYSGGGGAVGYQASYSGGGNNGAVGYQAS